MSTNRRRVEAVGLTVSVVIPTRNRFHLAAEAIASVRDQTWQRWELIVVDDASTDRTGEMVMDLARCDSRIRYIRLEERSERSAARNEGLMRARGRYILFLDDDDLLVPEAIETLMAACEAQPVIASVGARQTFTESGAVERVPHPRWPIVQNVWREVFVGCRWNIHQGQAIIRTDTVRRVGGWNERLTLAEDHELWFRLARAGPVHVIPPVVMRARSHGEARHTADPHRAEDLVREIHIDSLADQRMREIALRLHDANRCVRRGNASYADGDFARAIRAYVGAVRLAPWMVRSRIIGPGLLWTVLKSLAGTLMPQGMAGDIRKRRARGRRDQA